MRIQITAVHMVGGERHEHIASVRWNEIDNPSKQGVDTREEVIDFLRNSGNSAWVITSTNTVQVRIVNASPPYIRTYADNTPTDNLLELPRF